MRNQESEMERESLSGWFRVEASTLVSFPEESAAKNLMIDRESFWAFPQQKKIE